MMLNVNSTLMIIFMALTITGASKRFLKLWGVVSRVGDKLRILLKCVGYSTCFKDFGI